MSEISGARIDPNQKAHARIIRVMSYSVASVLAVLMLTAALPPLIADQSDRAILDAPVTLLTSPIAGEISKLDVRVGTKVPKGMTVAEITNARIDRSTLLTLQGKLAEYQQALSAAQSKKKADDAYLNLLDKEIAAQKKELVAQFEEQNAALEAMVGAAQAQVAEKGALRDREVSLVAKDTVSPYMLKPTTQQLSGAQNNLAAARAKLGANKAQLEAIHNDVFVGDNLVGIATLAQKRRDIAFDLENQKIEEAEAASGKQIQTDYVNAEKTRVAALEHARLASDGGGEVLSVGAAVGRHVSPGDSLVAMVDCSELFAVAIFSYRQASSLSVGTKVRISGAGNPQFDEGTVQQIMPKANDKSDALYAFPFPQTERREMYVIVKPNGKPQTTNEALKETNACPVGKWVTVTRADGWVPSTSVVWHGAEELASRVSTSLFGTHNAEASPRDAQRGM